MVEFDSIQTEVRNDPSKDMGRVWVGEAFEHQQQQPPNLNAVEQNQQRTPNSNSVVQQEINWNFVAQQRQQQVPPVRIQEALPMRITDTGSGQTPAPSLERKFAYYPSGFALGVTDYIADNPVGAALQIGGSSYIAHTIANIPAVARYGPAASGFASSALLTNDLIALFNATDTADRWAHGASALSSLTAVAGSVALMAARTRPELRNIGMAATALGYTGRFASEFIPRATNRVDYIQETPDGGSRLVSSPSFLQVRNASPEHVAAVDRALLSIPFELRQMIEAKGYSAVACGELADVMPDVDRQPRGYAEGQTFRHAGGVCEPGEDRFLVAERELRGDESVKNSAADTDHTVKHEFAHALDHSMANFWSHEFSESAEFEAAYAKDLAKLTDGQKKQFSYFVQEGDGGTSETFAETFAMLIMDPQASIDMLNRRAEFLQAFPTVAELMRNKIPHILDARR